MFLNTLTAYIYIYFSHGTLKPLGTNDSRCDNEWGTYDDFTSHDSIYSQPSTISKRSKCISDVLMKHSDFVDKELKLERFWYSLNEESYDYFDVTKSGTKAIWKPHKEIVESNYRAEVLAYEIDRLFGFNLVPQTVERSHEGIKGSLQIFAKSSGNYAGPPKGMKLQSLFDYLIDNGDRHSNNYLISPEGRVISIDNGMSFTGQENRRISFSNRESDIIQALGSEEGDAILMRMKGLNLDDLKKDFEHYLGEEDAQLLMSRIRHILSLE